MFYDILSSNLLLESFMLSLPLLSVREIVLQNILSKQTTLINIDVSHNIIVINNHDDAEKRKRCNRRRRLRL